MYILYTYYNSDFADLFALCDIINIIYIIVNDWMYLITRLGNQSSGIIARNVCSFHTDWIRSPITVVSSAIDRIRNLIRSIARDPLP